MTDFTQIPGQLNITATQSDDFSFSLDFDIDLTGYSFSAKVITAVSNTPISMTVGEVDLTEGQITITLEAAKMSKLATTVHHWYLDWSVPVPGATGIGGTGAIPTTTRRVLAGTFTVIVYP